jgi:hypothetical protein
MGAQQRPLHLVFQIWVLHPVFGFLQGSEVKLGV